MLVFSTNPSNVAAAYGLPAGSFANLKIQKQSDDYEH
jgi:hypothetical protein